MAVNTKRNQWYRSTCIRQLVCCNCLLNVILKYCFSFSEAFIQCSSTAVGLGKTLSAAHPIHQAGLAKGQCFVEWKQMRHKASHLLGTLSYPQSTFTSNHFWCIWLWAGLIWWCPPQLHHIFLAFCPGTRTSKYSKCALPGRARWLHPVGQPLANGGQKLVHPLSRPFWSPFSGSSNFASGVEPQVVRAVINALWTKISQFSAPILGIISPNKLFAHRFLPQPLLSRGTQPPIKQHNTMQNKTKTPEIVLLTWLAASYHGYLDIVLSFLRKMFAF